MRCFTSFIHLQSEAILESLKNMLLVSTAGLSGDVMETITKGNRSSIQYTPQYQPWVLSWQRIENFFPTLESWDLSGLKVCPQLICCSCTTTYKSCISEAANSHCTASDDTTFKSGIPSCRSVWVTGIHRVINECVLMSSRQTDRHTHAHTDMHTDAR